MCNKRAIEDEYHFIFECDRYNVDDIWETWKYIVNTAAESVARKVPKVKNYKNIWDKGLDKILKRRQEVNRLQRLHNKHDHMMVN